MSTNRFSLGDVSRHFGVLMTEKFVTETLEVPYVDKEKRSFIYDQDAIAQIGEKLSAYAAERGQAECNKTQAPKPKPKVETASPKSANKPFDEEEEEL
jgi:hypothetical protein